jgi:exodeoxyribonuclease III
MDGTLRSYLRKVDADILFFTEVKSSFHNLVTFPVVMQMFDDFGFPYRYWNEATIPHAGYSGVAMCSKIKPKYHSFGLGDPSLDCEGRTLTAAFPHFTVVLSYVPCSGMAEQFTEKRQKYNSQLRTHLATIQRTTENVIWLGDLNVAHLDNDAYTPNLKMPGTLQWEKDAFQKTLTENNLVDVYKLMHPDDTTNHLTYFENQEYFDKKYGLRLDYMLVTPSLVPYIVDTTVLHPYRGSDHLPMSLTLQLPKIVMPYREDQAVPMIFSRRGFQQKPPNGTTWTSVKPDTTTPQKLPTQKKKNTPLSSATNSKLMHIVATMLSMEMIAKLRNADSPDTVSASSVLLPGADPPDSYAYSSVLNPDVSSAERLQDLEDSCETIPPLGHRAVVEDFLLDTCNVPYARV